MMPLLGTLDVTPLEESSPIVEDLGTEQWTVERADLLQVMYEIDDAAITDLLPPALHPTIPPTLILNAMHVAASDAGPFTLAEARIGCRAATRPRGYLARAYCDNDAAIEMLRSRWGYPAERAEVRLLRTHYSSELTVSLNGQLILDAGLVSPEAISGGDIQYLANMNLARIRRDGVVLTRLIQVDPEYTFHSAERGQPRLDVFDDEAWRVEGAIPDYPISASFAVADVTFPRLRYMADPAQPPLQSIERI